MLFALCYPRPACYVSPNTNTNVQCLCLPATPLAAANDCALSLRPCPSSPRSYLSDPRFLLSLFWLGSGALVGGAVLDANARRTGCWVVFIEGGRAVGCLESRWRWLAHFYGMLLDVLHSTRSVLRRTYTLELQSSRFLVLIFIFNYVCITTIR